jgi:hypothetical protein
MMMVKKYIILNAPPLFIPGSKIGTIVTSRLEKYRIQTETWLEIISNIMIWLCLIYPIWKPDNANNHGDHKAKAYMAKPYVLFIESEIKPLKSTEFQKTSLCTANFEMIFESESFMYNLKAENICHF